MYTISRAAEQVGISAATLRAWERRYSIVTPHRTDGAYRVYTADDVRVLRLMKKLVDAGWSAGFAADEALRQTAVEVSAHRPTESPGDRPPTDRDSQPDAIAAEFVDAAATLDAARLDAVLDEMFALRRFETAVQNLLFPALEALGDGWESGRVSVAGEHLAAHAVGRRLAAAFDAAGNSEGGPRVVLGLAPGSRHELGLLAFAVAARRQGLRTAYLGADVPATDWLTACDASEVVAAVMSVRSAEDVASANDVIAKLGERRPDILIAVGGAAQAGASEEAVRLGDDIAAAAQALGRAVAHQSARHAQTPSSQGEETS